MMGLGMGVGFVISSNTATPSELAEQVVNFTEELMHVRGTLFATSPYNASTPQLELEINREKAELMGVPINAIFTTLQNKASFMSTTSTFMVSFSRCKCRRKDPSAPRSTIFPT